MVDPIEQLAHDHRELNGLLVALHEALARIELGSSSLDDELHEIQDGIEGFRDALLDHFAREQEGLFPFVVARVPSIRPRADVLIDEHDKLGTLLTAIARDLTTIDDVERTSGERPVGDRATEEPALDRRGALIKWQASLGDFEAMYSAHTRGELAFLDDVAKSLTGDPAATEQLRELLAEV